MSQDAIIPSALKEEILELTAVPEPEPEPEPELFPEPEPEPAPAPEPEPEPDPVQQAYNVLQGKYNAEVPRLSAELRTREEELERLRAENNSLKKAHEAEKLQADLSKMTDEEIMETYDISQEQMDYGRPLVELTIRQATMAANKKSDELDMRLRDAETAQFFSELDGKVPGWGEIEQKPEFISWLKEHPARQDVLESALSMRDSTSAARVYETFLVTMTPVQPKTSIEAQVMPSAVAASVPKTKPAKSTPQQLEQELDDLLRHHRNMSQADFDTAFADIQSRMRDI